MDEVARLVAIEEIRVLKARYFRFMDCKDWDGLEGVFAPDAIFDLREVNSVRHPMTGEWSPPFTDDVYRGRTAVLAMIKGAVERLVTAHYGHMPEIQITGSATAEGIWAMEDIIRNAPGEPAFMMQGYGHYHDTYERLATGWAIKTTRITRVNLIRD